MNKKTKEINQNEDYLLSGIATKKLEGLLPIGNIRAYFLIYTLLKKVTIKKEMESPDRECDKIRKALISLGKASWIMPDDYNFLKDELYKRMKASPAFMKFAEKTAFQRPGAPRDFPLDILIFALVEDLKKYKSRPFFELVADFLIEQNIITSSTGFTGEELRKRYDRLSLQYVEKTFSDYLIFNDLLPALTFFLSPHKVCPGFLSDYCLKRIKEDSPFNKLIEKTEPDETIKK